MSLTHAEIKRLFILRSRYAKYRKYNFDLSRIDKDQLDEMANAERRLIEQFNQESR
jgi:hypothetical protein